MNDKTRLIFVGTAIAALLVVYRMLPMPWPSTGNA